MSSRELSRRSHARRTCSSVVRRCPIATRIASRPRSRVCDRKMSPLAFTRSIALFSFGFRRGIRITLTTPGKLFNSSTWSGRAVTKIAFDRIEFPDQAPEGIGNDFKNSRDRAGRRDKDLGG